MQILKVANARYIALHDTRKYDGYKVKFLRKKKCPRMYAF
jgi:hypothetical protein